MGIFGGRYNSDKAGQLDGLVGKSILLRLQIYEKHASNLLFMRAYDSASFSPLHGLRNDRRVAEKVLLQIELIINNLTNSL